MKQQMKKLICIIAMFHLALLAHESHHSLTATQKKEIGTQIWHNEASKRYDRLVYWKENEKFPSLGICHFIWYPHRKADIYTQTFPDLLAFFKKKQVKMPTWLMKARYAPWKTKEAFDKAEQSTRMHELKKLMHDTIDLQVEFIIERLQQAWPRILKHAHPDKKEQVAAHYHALMQSPQGVYAMLDYLNFKGEGTDPKERYKGVGWGLLQVLEAIKGESNLNNFTIAAKSILTTRTNNAPAHKLHEKEWLQGWLNRIDTYQAFLSAARPS